MATHNTILRLGGAVLVAAVLGGCSLRIQAPIREVAYDFSDRDFYDRSYAPSPTYAAAPQGLQGPPVSEARGPRPNPPPACDEAGTASR